MPIILNGTTGITTPGITNTGPFTFQGVVELPAGAVGAPSLTTTGDTNTGIYFPAADTIAFVEGGVEALRINSSAQIAVNTAGTAGAPVITKTDDLNTGIFFPAADTIAFTEGGVESMRIDASGNLGLGVTPSAWDTLRAFDIGSGGALWGTAAQVGIGSNVYYATSNFRYKANNVAAALQLDGNIFKFFTAPSGTAGNAISFTQTMVLDSNGNLGVGSTAPTNSGGYKTLSLSGSTGGQITFQQSNADKAFIYHDATNFNIYNGVSGPLVFWTNSAERARITSAGAMGIGTSNPQARLEVNTASGADAYALAAWPFLKWDNSNELSYGGYTASQWQVLKFFTGGFERARIKSVGYSMFSNNGAYADSTYHEFSQSQGNWILHLRNISSTGTLGVPIVYSNAAPNNTANEFLYCVDSFINRAVIRSNGGLANFQANDVNLSDQRVKKDVKPLGSMWDKFKAIEIVTFKYKDQTHDDDNIGVIAQQVESVAPEFIDNDGWGEKLPEDGVPLKTVYTTDMYHAAIKALQEAMARIEVLEADMAVMKGLN